ncbi:type I-B CRISPR-associated protein Cas5b [Methanobacterium congolense]|jgi:CRISPR-associated protein Cas5h|uniref:CRISPR-associated protein Cas5 n=1 Tax=Methanobacterium congolense TaxID=118062 RepID=A0A1D3L2Y7_9EURY|nr:type I-B CRISPR-associated protein Cas5b [Methanobacterium congolense]SCG85879.1 CRISPR-associated protein Cas5 [Methanobacterium congolense]
MENKALVFDIWGDYAHFRKIETTTSPLTYSIPTGTAVAGLIAAMLGWQRDSYYDTLSRDNFEFSIRILEPIKKVRMNINLIKTDEGFYLWDIKGTPRSPTPYEFIKNPSYRIYIHLKEANTYKTLKYYLENHKTIFTPYLGISELIANFSFVGEYDINPKELERAEVHTVLKKDDYKIYVGNLEEGMRWSRENMPLYMNSDRCVTEYSEVLLEQTGKPLMIENGLFYEIGEDNVVFL